MVLAVIALLVMTAYPSYQDQIPAAASLLP
jgi:Tfp pilus assembly protein PilE